MRIIHPQPLAGRQTQFDVEFIDGVATVESLHPERELAFIQHGFTIEPDPEVEAPHQVALGEPILDLTALTKKQLQAIADDEGVEIPSRATHADMVDILSRRPATPIPGSTDNGDGSFTAEGTPLFELTLEQMRETAKLEGLDIADDATQHDIVAAFMAASADAEG